MSSGHEAVKDALVDHLATILPAWVQATAVDGWPATPALVAATEVLPVDEDKPWPCVLVSSTARPRIKHTGGDTYLAEYTVEVKVGVRSHGSKDYDAATDGRDRLLQAVVWALMAHPKLADGVVALTADMSDTTDPVAIDTKGRPVALGVLSLTVRQAETLPDPGAVESVDVEVDVTAVAAGQPLPEPVPEGS